MPPSLPGASCIGGGDNEVDDAIGPVSIRQDFQTNP